MSDAIMPLDAMQALADEIVAPFKAKLTSREVANLRHRVVMAIMHAQFDAAKSAAEQLQEAV
jgi:hypothetical protein